MSPQTVRTNWTPMTFQPKTIKSVTQHQIMTADRLTHPNRVPYNSKYGFRLCCCPADKHDVEDNKRDVAVGLWQCVCLRQWPINTSLA